MELRACTPMPSPRPPAAAPPPLLEAAARRYRQLLYASPAAIRYLRARGIGEAIARRFGVGYAPRRWRNIDPLLREYSAEQVRACGLQVARDHAGTMSRYDLFRDRIIFPIRTAEGRTVGFGGRSLRGRRPKYLNSPESIEFRKGLLLYGLDQALPAIRQYGCALVVEGYFDVLSLAQHGFDMAVGTLGTSCTREQLAQLRAVTRRILFCFDADRAGLLAADRALLRLMPDMEDGLDIGLVLLPAGHDPDSYVRRHGAQAFDSLLENSTPAMAFLVSRLCHGCDMRYPEGRSRCVHRAKAYYDALPRSQFRQDILRYCTGLLECSEEELLAVWRCQDWRSYAD